MIIRRIYNFVTSEPDAVCKMYYTQASTLTKFPAAGRLTEPVRRYMGQKYETQFQDNLLPGNIIVMLLRNLLH